MTAVNWLAAALFMAWALFLFWYFGTLHVCRQDRPSLGRRRPSYAEGLERMRAALTEAHRETEPGGTSPDLAACREIWPDAPTRTPKEWS